MEFEHLYDLSTLGAIINKTIMPRYRKGNPAERVVETAQGMMNAIGTPTKGTEEFLAVQLPYMRQIGTTVIVSVGGMGVGDFVELCRVMEGEEGIDGLELDLSCPNNDGTAPLALSPTTTYDAVAACRAVTRLPIIAKLSPMVTDIIEIARAALNAGADALCVANTYPALAIDIEEQRPILGHVTGGLSGPAIKPMTLRHVWQIVDQLDAPVVAAGGIATARDAIEYLLAGAKVVQVGTANFYDPYAMPKIIEGIEAYMKRMGVDTLDEIIGAALRRVQRQRDVAPRTAS